MAHVYLLHGLRVHSEIGLDAPIGEGDDIDLTVRWGERRAVPASPASGQVLARLDLPGASSSLTLDGDAYTLRFASMCDCVLDGRMREASVHLAPELDPEIASIFVSGNLLAAVLVLKGMCVLHASAVESGGRALCFVGGSGMGKSTLAAICCAAGSQIVSDDVLRVDVGEDGPACYRGSQQVRLRPTASEIALAFPESATRMTADGRVAVAPAATPRVRLPIAALVVPVCSRESQELEVQQLDAHDGLVELVSFPRTAGWKTAAPVRHQFGVLAELARRVPVYRAVCPWGPPFDPGLASGLLEQALPADADRPSDGGGARTGARSRR